MRVRDLIEALISMGPEAEELPVIVGGTDDDGDTADFNVREAARMPPDSWTGEPHVYLFTTD